MSLAKETIEHDANVTLVELGAPNDADKALVHTLMQRVTEPGKMAGWIAPPDRGINANPVEYQYVKL